MIKYLEEINTAADDSIPDADQRIRHVDRPYKRHNCSSWWF